jgi:hypothetical protein
MGGEIVALRSHLSPFKRHSCAVRVSPPSHGERERGAFLSGCRCLSAVDALDNESTMPCCSRPAPSHMFFFDQDRLRHALVTGRVTSFRRSVSRWNSDPRLGRLVPQAIAFRLRRAEVKATCSPGAGGEYHCRLVRRRLRRKHWWASSTCPSRWIGPGKPTSFGREGVFLRGKADIMPTGRHFSL